MRRIGVLMGYPESDSEAQAFIAAFREGIRGVDATPDIGRASFAFAGRKEQVANAAEERGGIAMLLLKMTLAPLLRRASAKSVAGDHQKIDMHAGTGPA